MGEERLQEGEPCGHRQRGKTNVKLTSGLCLSANFDPWSGTEQQDDVFTSRLLKLVFTVKDCSYRYYR